MSKYLKFFVGISVFYLLLIAIGKEDLAWYFKPLLLPGLLLATNESNNFPTKKWLFLALTFSWIGDVILMFADKGELFFIFGLVSFLIGHILFITLFIKQERIGAPNKLIFGIGILAVAAYLYTMLTILLPSLGDLKIPVSVYAFVISLMLVIAIRGALTWRNPMNILILNGAVSFVTSDSILAINKFFTPLPNASLLIMSTYLIAQYLITFGILKLNEKK
ncbi:lysoplasmalogenase [Flavobacterium amniphilum]|uniref:lysoplasmalogenase n=1 Tax=Flavobacterium amniphilum TaxID=1834035 RepID=UPI00202A9AB4|nr:lysoplasmalogenase [Flavobacterium amniphilum]MCL9806626.1 lysoplasmalogenase [Flavobacterium amniphilum]